MTIYEFFDCAFESQCDESTSTKLYANLDDAKAALKKWYDNWSHVPSRKIAEDGMSAEAKSGDWFYSVYIEPKEIHGDVNSKVELMRQALIAVQDDAADGILKIRETTWEKVCDALKEE